ncbi:MAG: O-antigen ligase family protein [Oscillospiraceae bacterium]|nr:O-antigen ligase family protein [Oscillospiraceae bacterium]
MNPRKDAGENSRDGAGAGSGADSGSGTSSGSGAGAGVGTGVGSGSVASAGAGASAGVGAGTGAAAALLPRLAAGSGAARAVRSASRHIKWFSRASKIVTFLKRPERLTSFFFLSSIGRAITAVPDSCTRTLKRTGVYLNRNIGNTLTLWALKWFGERFDVFFILFVAAHALLPFALYRNPITIAALAFLTFSACARVAFVRNQSAVFSLKRVDPVFLLYFLSIAASTVYSMLGAGSGAASLTTSVLYLAAIYFTFLIANAYYEHSRLVMLIRVLVGAATLVALYGIYQYLRGIPIDVTQTDQTTGGASLAMGRADSTLGNPNVLAAWLLLTIPFAAALAFFAKNWLRKGFAASVVLLLAVSLLLTQSRSGWAGLFAAGVVFVFLLDWRLVPLFAAAGLLSLPFWPRFILDRLLIAGADTSSVYRWTIYAGAYRMASANWATGVGIGLEYFKRLINNYVYFAYETAPVHSHNLLLQIWLESGIVAVLSFLWALIRLIKKGGAYIFSQKRGATPNIPARYRRPGPGGAAYETRMILTACISAMIGFLVMGCFEYVWFFPRCMNYFFMIVGIFYCAVNLSASAANNSPRPQR